MSKPVAITCLLFVSLISQISAFEIGDKVVISQESDLKEGGVLVVRARMGDLFLVQGVDGRRLLLEGAGSVWADDADVLSLEAAVEHFSALIKKDPANWEAFCARGRAREELGQSYTGMSDLDEAIRINPCCETYRRRGVVYANRGMNQRALADFDEAIRRDNRSMAALRNRAILFGKRSEYEKSLADFNKAVEIEPESAHLIACRGYMLLQETPKKALVDADAALRLIPTYSDAIKLRGFALYRLNRCQEAAAEFSKVLREHPRDVEALLKRGNIWQDLESYDKGIADLTKVIELFPSSGAYFARGIMYRAAKDLSKAEADLDQAVKLDPKHRMTRFARGIVRFQRGDTQKAIQDFDVAIQLDPSSLPSGSPPPARPERTNQDRSTRCPPQDPTN